MKENPEVKVGMSGCPEGEILDLERFWDLLCDFRWTQELQIGLKCSGNGSYAFISLLNIFLRVLTK